MMSDDDRSERHRDRSEYHGKLTTNPMDAYFIIAIHPRVSVGMDAGRPCAAAARAGRPNKADEGRSRIPIKEGRSSGPQRPERDGPALLQGGGGA